MTVQMKNGVLLRISGGAIAGHADCCCPPPVCNPCECYETNIGGSDCIALPTVTVSVSGTTNPLPFDGTLIGAAGQCAAPSTCPDDFMGDYVVDCLDYLGPLHDDAVAACFIGPATAWYYVHVQVKYYPGHGPPSGYASAGGVLVEIDSGIMWANTRPQNRTAYGFKTQVLFQLLEWNDESCNPSEVTSGVRIWAGGEGATHNCCDITDVDVSFAIA